MRLSTKVTRAATFSLARVFAGHVIGVVAFVIITRKVDPGEYGVWALLLAAAQICYQMLIVSPTLALVRQEDDLEEGLISSCLTLIWIRSWVLAAAVFVGAIFINDPYSYLFLAIGGYLILLPLRFLPNVFFWRSIKLGKLAISETLEIITLQTVAVFGILSGWGVIAFAIALLSAALVGAGSLILLSGRWPNFSGLYLARQFSDKLRPFNYFITLALGRDFGQVILIAVFIGLGSAGIYAWANAIAAGVMGLFLPLINGLFIGLSKDRDVDRVSSAIDISLRNIALGGVFLLTPLAAGLIPFVNLVFQNKWDEGIPVLLGLCFLTIILLIQTVLSSLAYADGRAKSANRWLVVYLVAVAFLGIPLAWALGLAAYPAVSILVALAVLSWSWHDTFKIYAPGQHLLRDLITSIGTGTIIAIAGLMLTPNSLVGLLAAVGVSLVLLFFSGKILLHQSPVFLLKQSFNILKGR